MTSSLPCRQIERIPTLRPLHLLQNVEDLYDGVRDEGVGRSLKKKVPTNWEFISAALWFSSSRIEFDTDLEPSLADFRRQDFVVVTLDGASLVPAHRATGRCTDKLCGLCLDGKYSLHVSRTRTA